MKCIICNISTEKCLKRARPVLHILLSYVLPLSNVLKPKEIRNFIQGNGTFRFITSQWHFITFNPLVATTSWETWSTPVLHANTHTAILFSMSQYIHVKCSMPKIPVSFCIQSHFAVRKSACFSGYSDPQSSAQQRIHPIN